MKKTFDFGKIDFNGIGRKINPVTIDIELKNGNTDKPVFSAIGFIWNSTRTDCICCGQIFDEINIKNSTFLLIKKMWRKYHLNDCHSGTEKQESALQELRKEIGYYPNYEEACKYLESTGLLIDNGYEYGTGWLYREIPKEDLEIIKQLFE